MPHSPVPHPRRRPRWAALTTAVAVAAAGLVAAGGPAAAAAEVYQVPPSGVFQLQGRGYGHGKGMSQWGAEGAARLGHGWQTIVGTYYPGTADTVLADRQVQVVLTREGVEGRRPVGTLGSDGRYECDTSSATAAVRCRLEVLPASGLTIRDSATGFTGTLPAYASDGTRIDRWWVANSASGLQLQMLAGGSWRPLAFNGKAHHAGPLLFGGPAVQKVRYLDGSVREYRGRVGAVRVDAHRLARVNYVGMEDYLLSVVPKEVILSWRDAALQSQAVAARSFAAWHRKGGAWDLCDSTFCQVYGGLSTTPPGGSRVVNENSRTTAAVGVTRGHVRTYGGAVIRAQFSASNGGWSVDGGVAWLPARQDDWDGVVPNPPNTSHAWSGELPASALERRFGFGRLRELVVLSRDGNGIWGGRILDVELRGTAPDGTTRTVRTTGEAVRFAHPLSGSAPKGLRSEWFRPNQAQETSPTGPMSASSARSGTADLVSRTPGGAAVHYAWDAASGLTGPNLVGGSIVGAPAGASRGSGSLAVFARGQNNAVYVAGRRSDGTWAPWEGLGGNVTSRPAAAADGSGRLDVAVRGTDAAVWRKSSPAPGSWSAWEKVTASTLPGTGPALTWTSDGRLELVAVGSNRRVYRKTLSGGTWSAWKDLGGTVETDVSVAGSAGGAATIAVRGLNGAAFVRTLTATGDSGWRSLGGSLVGSPVVAAAHDGSRVDVFARGQDGNLYRNTRTSTAWSGWQRAG